MVFKDTRLPVDTVVENVDALMEVDGLSEEGAVAATLECFPSVPGGAEAIRAVLAYREAHEHQLQPRSGSSSMKVCRDRSDHLPGHSVTTVPIEGWASVKNGKLLALIEEAGFNTFITAGKNLEAQSLQGRPFSILLLSTNHWPSIRLQVANPYQPTVLIRVPMPLMVIWISSCCCRVNSSGGTMPVPVSKKQPLGKLLSR